MKPSLLILAAGLGSRYGGVKQMDKIGPSGESIIDYSIYDAIYSGFGKVVFVLNERILDDFKAIYEPRLKNRIDTEYVLQKTDDIPEGFVYNKKRMKPWGTAHAILAARHSIREPFAVINADDFYGRQAFEMISVFLKPLDNNESSYAMVGYRLKNTLSDHGTVSRGICQINEEFLTEIVERTHIRRKDNDIVFTDREKEFILNENTIVSMNFWGLTPVFFRQAEAMFKIFLEKNAQDSTAEFYIPYVMHELIKNGKASCKVLTSNDKWFGVTYREDKSSTIEKLKLLIGQGIYPKKLWS